MLFALLVRSSYPSLYVDRTRAFFLRAFVHLSTLVLLYSFTLIPCNDFLGGRLEPSRVHVSSQLGFSLFFHTLICVSFQLKF